MPGSIVLDLHRMDKVLEVSEKFAYAVVEPGVTFGDLYEHCAAKKLKVWPSTASLGWGSIVGNVSGPLHTSKSPIALHGRKEKNRGEGRRRRRPRIRVNLSSTRY